MFETYKKPNKHPSMSVGEQDSEVWDSEGGSTTSYSTNNGAKDTVYNGDKSKTLECSGGSGSKNKTDYPKKSTKFGTEK